jgi:hypothetical protein
MKDEGAGRALQALQGINRACLPTLPLMEVVGCCHGGNQQAVLQQPPGQPGLGMGTLTFIHLYSHTSFRVDL